MVSKGKQFSLLVKVENIKKVKAYNGSTADFFFIIIINWNSILHMIVMQADVLKHNDV